MPDCDDRAGWVDQWRSNCSGAIAGIDAAFFSNCDASPAVILEMACLDLMRRRRGGDDAVAEQYVAIRPELGEPKYLLDLVDAEICVRQETGALIKMAAWKLRLPSLEKEIRTLLMLGDSHCQFDSTPQPKSPSPSPSPSPLPSISTPPSRSRPDTGPNATATFDGVSHCSLQDFSFNDFSNVQFFSSASRVIDGVKSFSPDWFLPQQIVAMGPGHWIIRGRHRDHDARMILKLIAIEEPFLPSKADSIIENISLGSSIENATWVGCESATVRHRHMAVLRPWVEGVAWPLWNATATQRCGAMMPLVAAVAAAHRRGVWHGGIHGENVIVDHHGQLRLIDGGSCRRSVLELGAGTGKDQGIGIDDAADQVSCDPLNGDRRAIASDVEDLLKLMKKIRPDQTFDANQWENWIAYFANHKTDSANAAASILDELPRAIGGERPPVSGNGHRSLTSRIRRMLS